MGGGEPLEGLMERRTICLPQLGTQKVLQIGDHGFKQEINRLYLRAESNALEALITLKSKLQPLSGDGFWAAAVEGIANIIGAQISFVFKRMVVDDHGAAVEMPPYGEVGSCLMASAVHFRSPNGSKDTLKETRFHAYGCPCTYMRHDKVFLIPDRLNDFILNNPNHLPTPAEAYIALPLFIQGKNVAHFGAMWSKEGAADRQLSWAFIEMLLHALEDIILQRLVEGSDFVKPAAVAEKRSIIPHDAVTVAQSLRPYAGSLSHELRTPMQGIVGMLDVMYTTVQEAVEFQVDPYLRKVFAELKEYIEVVQDSSRRAVEAADNVVHAYDMDMSFPEPAPPLLDDLESASPYSAAPIDRRPEIFVAGSNLPLSRKRGRDDAFTREASMSSASNKAQRMDKTKCDHSQTSQPSQEIKDGVHQAEELRLHIDATSTRSDTPTVQDGDVAASSTASSHRMVAPGLRHTNMRECFQHIINEGLKVGGRPESTYAQETENGEIIEVRTRGSDGTAKTKIIEWEAHPNMPTTSFTDEKDLSKLISCVFLNAIKFTDQQGGRVRIRARMSQRGRYVSVKISDNGPGIPAAFLPKLFMPFSRENESITRQSEGLGLGLLVGKGIARKLGGDLLCVKAVTDGPDHGSEFEIKVPVTAGETISRPSSPFGSPVQHGSSLAPLDIPKPPPFANLTPFAAHSPTKVSRALQDGIGDDGDDIPSTPPSPKSIPALAVPKPTVTVTSSPPTPPNGPIASSRPRIRKSFSNPVIDRDLANRHPLTFLVAEDNKINRKLLISMLGKFGYKCIHEAHDGAEAVRQMTVPRANGENIDVILMDLWMPLMDGYEATERILANEFDDRQKPTVLAVTADVTDGAQERAARVGMKGFMTKPYKIHDLQRLITEYCANRAVSVGG